MNKASKVLVVVVAAAGFTGLAFAQSPQSQAVGSAKSNDATQARAAAKMNKNKDAGRGAYEGEMADQVHQPSPPVDKNTKSSDPVSHGGTGAFEAEMDDQVHQPSPRVDRNAKPADPMKNISKMTPAERAQLRNDVVKESKP